MMQSSQDTLKRPASVSQQPPSPPQPSPSPLIQPSRPPPPGTSAGIHEPLFPPRVVPPSLNHLGVIAPGHYLFDQIPFLVPPPGIYTTLVMTTLCLPNLTIGLPVWYLDPPTATPPGQPKPYLALTPVQPVSMNFPTAIVP